MYFSNVMFYQVELRAFCSKHSDIQEKSSILPLDGSVAFGSEFSVDDSLPVILSAGRQHNLKIDCRNGEDIDRVSDGSPDKLSPSGSPNTGLPDTSECGSLAQLDNNAMAGLTDENVNASDSHGFALVLKKVFYITSQCMCIFRIACNYCVVNSK